jgi:hypothetical protein
MINIRHNQSSSEFKLLLLFAAVQLSLFTNIFAGDFLKLRKNFQLTDWKFYKGEIYRAENKNISYTDLWEDITVPHTWNARDVLTKGYECYQGPGWYRSEFKISGIDRKERYFIRFEGVCLVADVYINGMYLGRHKGGYSAFCFEITRYIEEGKNVIAVKADNTMQPDVAPSGTHLYPLFGGIYRPVTVFSAAELCISPMDYASSGTYIRQKNISEKEAFISVETLLDYQYAEVLQVKSPELLPPSGKKGQGLYGEYFANPEFKGKPVHTRVDEYINFNYRLESPFRDMENDNFSVRWTGRFIPEKSGLYRFIIRSDDGSRLYLNDEKVIDNWGAHAAAEKYYEKRMEAGEEFQLRLEYNEYTQDASMKFGWVLREEPDKSIRAVVNTSITDSKGNVIKQKRDTIEVTNNQITRSIQEFRISSPHLWNARIDPYLYTLNIKIEDMQGNNLDETEEKFGLRYFRVDKKKGLLLNGKPYHLYGVCRHQEWEGLGSALLDSHHEKDIELILELGARGVRLAHYQQADKMYGLCDENGLVVWAEIPNTPSYRPNVPSYLQNCKDQLTELIKQNYNHPSILFWGMYNEISIPVEDLRILHETARELDPYRLTTQADFSQVSEKHYITDVAAWNWYFGWYYGQFDDYGKWFNRLHKEHPEMIAGLSEYGAGASISQQQENPERPDPANGRFFPEQYQRLYHEKVWAGIKNRDDIWCKFIWNMFDFSWTVVKRGDRDFINHKGLVTHDRKVKKDAFYFYKANWSDEPVLYILSRRNVKRTEKSVPVEVYTNLNKVELYINGMFISEKETEPANCKIIWENISLLPGRNKISVIGFKDENKFTDACEWTYYPQ